ncbi:MAG: 2Fe-2S iron-sulfur cluster-binding protein [Candidatus Promineifilaceae bacterium]
MGDEVKLKIDGREVSVPHGTSILEAATKLGIEIPVVCYHPHLSANGLCRICAVDVGWRVQVAACVTMCTDGMEVRTKSDDVIRARRTNLEMLASAVNLDEAPDIQALLEEFDADRTRFSAGKRRDVPVFDDNPFFLRDYSQCINCWRCVQVCAEDAQYAFALTFNSRGFETTIGTFMGQGMTDTTCVFCGQCVGVCPTGALKPIRQSLLERGKSPNEAMKLARPRNNRKRD